MSIKSIDNKIVEYETFVNDVLRNDLKKVMQRHEHICDEISEYLNVKSVIKGINDETFTSSSGSLKAQCDIGCNFYVQCVAPKTDKIFVHLGMGFFVEFTLEEALKFIEKKEKQLNEELETLTQQSCKIKAHIKVVLEALGQIQGISSEERTKPINIWD